MYIITWFLILYLLKLNSEAFQLLEKYTCLVYEPSSSVSHVNVLRQHMFTQKTQEMKKLPPTQVGIYVY